MTIAVGPVALLVAVGLTLLALGVACLLRTYPAAAPGVEWLPEPRRDERPCPRSPETREQQGRAEHGGD